MTSKRGFTLVELMLVTAITGVIVGALGGLFVFVGARASQAMSKNAVLLQVQLLSNELEQTLSEAQSCKLVHVRGGHNGLKCILPVSGSDLDADGVADEFGAERVDPTGREGFGLGKRVWFFMSDGTGNPTAIRASGGTMWRFWRNDDSLPTLSDIDSSFAYYYGNTGKPRWNLIDSISFTANANGTVTYTIGANKVRRANRTKTGADSTAETETLTLTRTVLCKNWRK